MWTLHHECCDSKKYIKSTEKEMGNFTINKKCWNRSKIYWLKKKHVNLVICVLIVEILE